MHVSFWVYLLFFKFIFCYRDLAIELRIKLGHWFRVLQLLKTDGSLGK